MSATGAPPAARRAGLAQASWSWLVALAAVALALRLGFWQLDRAAQKIALQAALDARGARAAADGAELARDAAGGARRSTTAASRLHGRWLAERTVFLDNRQMDGKVGFFVVTPLRLDGRRERGAGAARLGAARLRPSATLLPPVATPAGPGRGRGPHRPAAVAAVRVRRRRAAGRSGRISTSRRSPARPGSTLLPLSVIASATSRAVATTACSATGRAPAADVHKHYGYAFQWFALARG